MDVVRKLEDTLAGVFKNAPKMSEGTKEGWTKAWPVIALVFGILNLLSALTLWRLVSTVYDDLNGYYQNLTGVDLGPSSTDKLFLYAGIVLSVVVGVILLMAFKPLQKRLRRGWDLMFLANVLNLAYAVLSLFLYGRGIVTFLFSLVISTAIFYVLFQVKDKFNGSAPVQGRPSDNGPVQPPKA